MLRQFVSNLIHPSTRLSSVYAVRPIRFYSAEQNSQESSDTAEDDKLYRLLEIEMRGHDPAVMKSYVKFATTAAKHLDIDVGKCWTPRLPYEKERYTILKSAYVHKKHRVQYEFRTYFQFMQFHRITGSTLSTFLEYIERNLPEGVAIKATKVELLALPEHMQTPPQPVKSEQTE